MTAPQPRKKLIEVALPLDEINAACKADKDRRTGTIRNLHKWFAPMPLPAWRGLLFATLIDDPGDDEKRAYLLDVIKRLVANGADLPGDAVVEEARKLVEAQYPAGVPTVMDPFCGGGSTLVEAQRLGLPTFGSDLNPVPALITRTLTQLLPTVYGRQPLHQKIPGAHRTPGKARDETGQLSLALAGEQVLHYTGLKGLASDITHYALRIRERAWEQLSSYYPSGTDETPIAWVWARTVACPNPACGIETVLATSWWLSKRRTDRAWLEYDVVEGQVEFRVGTGATGNPPASAKIGDGVFTCMACPSILNGPYLRAEGKAGRLGLRMLAVISAHGRKRCYRAATATDRRAAGAVPADAETADVPLNAAGQGVRVGLYGMTSWDRLFTARQLLALATFADLVSETRDDVIADGGSPEWADAIVTVLALAVGRLALYNSSQTRITFPNDGTTTRFNGAFARNDLPMTWDFPELDMASKNGTWMMSLPTVLSSLDYVTNGQGETIRCDARTVRSIAPAVIATDPPYFDAIGYADLSDYFYIWHRRALRRVHPDLYGTIAAPKAGELTAVASHHGNSKNEARQYFIDGFTDAFRNLQHSMAPEVPMLVVYASKEQKGGREEETRWSSILTAIIRADLEIVGTWPIRGTRTARMIGHGTNAVASYVAMVCRPRAATADNCSLSDFNRSLRRELKPAVQGFQAAGILPVDLAQAAMGPGMQVYSRYKEVIDQAGNRVPVERALQLINAALGEVLDEQEGELDPHSRFSVAWWERHGWEPAAFGEADQLARPQGLSVDELVRAEVVHYPRPGFVAVLGSGDLDRTWRPADDARPTAWEAVHHLADRLIDGGGTRDAARLLSDIGVLRDPAQALVYRLHDIAARKGWTKDQERYNALIGSWSDLLALSATEENGLF